MSKKTKGKGSRKPMPSPMKKGKPYKVAHMAAKRAPAKSAKPTATSVSPPRKSAKAAPKPVKLSLEDRIAALEQAALDMGHHLPHAANRPAAPNANS
jgi:hypothetical protein